MAANGRCVGPQRVESGRMRVTAQLSGSWSPDHDVSERALRPQFVHHTTNSLNPM
jgi:hypothetical protein